VNVLADAFLISALVGTEWTASRTGHFTAGEKGPLYKFDRSLAETRSRPRRYGEVKMSWPYCDTNSEPSVVQSLVAMQTAPSRLASYVRGFWRLSVSRIPELGNMENIEFPKLDMLPSSGDGKGTPTLLGPLERSNSTSGKSQSYWLHLSKHMR
jgi:hypothetical protein